MYAEKKMPPEFRLICQRWSAALINLNDEQDRIEYVQKELPTLLHKRDIFVELLGNITGGQPYPDIRQPQMFDDEILLYLSTKPMFSIRMFIYEPGVNTPIHDHTSWGVIGSALGKIGVMKYIRLDDGATKGYAQLRKTENLVLEAGQTDVALPLNLGIHQTGNPDSQTSIMVSVYGRPLRQIYIHRYDLEHKKVFRMYPPRIKKRLLATQALDILDKLSTSSFYGK